MNKPPEKVKPPPSKGAPEPAPGTPTPPSKPAGTPAATPAPEKEKSAETVGAYTREAELEKQLEKV